VVIVFVVGIAIVAPLAVAGYGVRWNFTQSVPGTIWLKRPLAVDVGEALRGQYVYVCLPTEFVQAFEIDRHVGRGGRCGGTTPLLKRVVGVTGDSVRIDETGITVNGSPVANTRPYSKDGDGQALPKPNFSGVLETGKAVIAGDTEFSFDSRYFGVIEKQWIAGTGKRIF